MRRHRLTPDGPHPAAKAAMSHPTPACPNNAPHPATRGRDTSEPSAHASRSGRTGVGSHKEEPRPSGTAAPRFHPDSRRPRRPAGPLLRAHGRIPAASTPGAHARRAPASGLGAPFSAGRARSHRPRALSSQPRAYSSLASPDGRWPGHCSNAPRTGSTPPARDASTVRRPPRPRSTSNSLPRSTSSAGRSSLVQVPSGSSTATAGRTWCSTRPASRFGASRAWSRPAN